MRRSAWPAVVLLAVLSGCTAGPAPAAGHGTPDAAVVAAPPPISSCWQQATPGRGSPLDSPARVPCAGPHDAETVWVGTDVLDPAAAYPTAADLAAGVGTVEQALDGICSTYAVDYYLGDDVPGYGLFATSAPRLPTREEWAAGARWVRCDVVYGIRSTDPAPGRMAGALKGAQAAAYHLCTTGPPDGYSELACSQPHTAEVIGPHQLPPGTPWPGSPAARAALARSCASALPVGLTDEGVPAGVHVDVDTGPEATWYAGRLVLCVLTRDDGAPMGPAILH